MICSAVSRSPAATGLPPSRRLPPTAASTPSALCRTVSASKRTPRAHRHGHRRPPGPRAVSPGLLDPRAGYPPPPFMEEPPVKIAMVSEHASPLATLGGVDAGGQNVHVAALAREIAEAGHEVTVYTRKDRED